MRYLLIFSSFFLFCNLEAADFIKTEQSVLDKKHHLEWQDNREAKEDIWKLAGGYCRQLKLRGYNDWRLPTQNELSRLSASQKAKKYFTFLETNIYWSSDIDKTDNFNAVTVYTGNGFDSFSDKCEKDSIICVRNLKK